MRRQDKDRGLVLRERNNSKDGGKTALPVLAEPLRGGSDFLKTERPMGGKGVDIE